MFVFVFVVVVVVVVAVGGGGGGGGGGGDVVIFSLPRLTFLAVTLNRAEVIRNCTSASAAACHAWTAWKDKMGSSCFILETKGK